MTSEWYQKFYEMRETLFDESPEAASARAFSGRSSAVTPSCGSRLR